MAVLGGIAMFFFAYYALSNLYCLKKALPIMGDIPAV
jgi:hypothetical protein